MNLSEAITDVISKTQENHCGNCKIGKAPAELTRLKNTLETGEPVAPESKLQGKTAVSKPQKVAKIGSPGSKACNSCNMTLTLDSFPKNKTCAGGRAGTCKDCAYERARKHAADKKRTVPAAAPEAPPAAGIIRCKLCDYRAIDAKRLESHMRTNHGANGL